MIDAGTPIATKLLDVMSHAAKSDGQVDTVEIDLIVSASMQLTGTAFDREKVMQIMDLAESKVNNIDFKGFGAGLSGKERLGLVHGALMVIAADGKLEGKEKEFVARLARGLNVPTGAVQELFNEMLKGGSAMRPT